MRHPTDIADQPPALDEVPILLEAGRQGPPEPAPRITVDRSRLVDGFGVFSRDDVRDRLSHDRIEAPADLDWSQVVDLRRGHRRRSPKRPRTSSAALGVRSPATTGC